MLSAVDFDDQTRVETNEIDDIGADWILPAKGSSSKAMCS